MKCLSYKLSPKQMYTNLERCNLKLQLTISRQQPGQQRVCSVIQWCLTLCNPMDYIAHQAPLSMEFSRQVYWSGLPCPPPGDFSNPGIKPAAPALQVDSLPLSHQGSPRSTWRNIKNIVLHERSQSQKDTYYINCNYVKNRQIHTHRKQISGCQGLEGQRNRE